MDIHQIKIMNMDINQMRSCESYLFLYHETEKMNVIKLESTENKITSALQLPTSNFQAITHRWMHVNLLRSYIFRTFKRSEIPMK